MTDLCDTCEGAKWGTAVPMPGLFFDAAGHVERCDDCAVFKCDEDAAHALADEVTRRSELDESNLVGRVRFYVEGYEHGG